MRGIILFCVAAEFVFRRVICLSLSSVRKLSVSSFSRLSGRVGGVRFGGVGVSSCVAMRDECAASKLSYSYALRRWWVFLATTCVFCVISTATGCACMLLSPLPPRSWLRDILMSAAMLVSPHSARALPGD